MNRAAELATGDYLLLLNPDTVLHDDGGLARLLAFARSHPEHGLFGGRTLWPDGTLCPGSVWGAPSLWSHACFALALSSAFKGSRVFDPDSLGGWRRDSVRRVGVVTGCLLLVTREDWDALGGFDERFFMYGEDVDLSLRAARAGRPPVLVPAIEITHTVGVSSGSRPGRKTLVMKGKATVVRKHSGPAGRTLALGLLRLGVGIRALLRVDPWPEVWRARGEWLDNVVLVSPSREYLARLPFGKLPDRNDFKRFESDYEGRLAYWKKAVAESARLADEFLAFAGRPDLSRVLPL